MKKIIYVGFAVLMYACTETKNESVQPASAFSMEGKKVFVYITADSTNLRLSSSGELGFKQKGQPFENEISVFVDPTKTYQEFLGIGGALTDASAETFAKLPKDKQQELLQAYFDTKKGYSSDKKTGQTFN